MIEVLVVSFFHFKALETAKEAAKCDPQCPQINFLLYKVAILRKDKEMGKQYHRKLIYQKSVDS